MVEGEITDGRRIAELLASELSGIAVGPLAGVSVVDADRDVDPTAAGAFAYGLAFEGEDFGEVRVRPSEAVVSLDVDWAPGVDADAGGLRTHHGTLVVERGVAVKQATDAIRAALAAERSG